MENPRTWSPLCREMMMCGLSEPKEIVDHLIEKELLPPEPYWEMLAAISEALVQQELDNAAHLIGGSWGSKAEQKLKKILA